MGTMFLGLFLIVLAAGFGVGWIVLQAAFRIIAVSAFLAFFAFVFLAGMGLMQ